MNDNPFPKDRKAKPFGWFLKLVAAGVCALVVLTAFSYIYYNPGTHITSEAGATDYVWESDTFYSKAIEGFAWGKVDHNGYNNSYPADKDGEIDILLMGSSHMEAFNVAQNENTGYLLNDLLHKNGREQYVYNIGMSSHNFLKLVSNFSKALKTFRPNDYVLVEMTQFNYPLADMYAAYNDTIGEFPSYDSGFIYELQKNPYFKLLYAQLNGESEAGEAPETSYSEKYYANFDNACKCILNRLKGTCNVYDCKLILFYHPRLFLDSKGDAYENGIQRFKEIFAANCEQLDITFVDMTDTFIAEYEESYTMPNGFYNTAVGQGHLNKNGHRMIAERLYQTICGLEER